MSRRIPVLLIPLLVALGVAFAVNRSSEPAAQVAKICHDERSCAPVGGPESIADLRAANTSRATRALAPSTALKPGAQAAAVAQARQLPTTGGTWKPFGNTPLQGNNTDYDTNTGSTREGLPGLSGRVTAFTKDSAGTLYAAVSYGGIWKSSDNAGTWTSIGEGLPTQVTAGVAWTSAAGGTIIALTGDNSYGGGTASGLGVYYTRDGGKTWKRSAGVPDGLLGFRLAVDPTDPNKIYAATGGGLFRSTDAGQTFNNVNLPTGDCAGKNVDVKNCGLANMVTDVVVQGTKNPQTATGKPGAVMAAVGWRAGNVNNVNGVPQSPGNGIYTSDTGAPGSFKNMDMANHAVPVPPSGNDPLTQARIGRIALGIADGASQNHQVVYAIVQDAVKFNGGVAGLDVNDEQGATSAAQSDYLNGVWVSTDFGASWKQLEGSTAIDNDTTSGSALAPPTCKAPAVISYCPGIQAWYNLWVLPDPTRQTASGVPTRVLFGLEEVWANNPNATPPTGLDGTTSTKFDVIGRYYGDQACTLLNATNGLPFCPATIIQGGAVPKTTTHPDQHGAFFVPDGKGGVTFLSGNDGGVFAQHTDSASDFKQEGWGNGNNSGLNTLLPYDAVMAKDGTVYMGLQDNGEGKIEPSGKAYTVFGGDGFFTAVDPDDSKVAYEEYVYGAMSKTVDGGKTWNSVDPGLTSGQFSTPFEMDPASAQHLVIGGRDIQETTDGATTWKKVYDLGTQKKPGDANAGADPTTDDGPDNQVSAIDTIGSPPVVTGKTGPPTKNFTYTGGPLAPNPTPGLSGEDTFIPGTYDDHPFTIAPSDNDGLMTIEGSWDDPSGSQDYDLYLYKKAADGTLTKISDSATSANPEKISVQAPPAGDYVIRMSNFTAASPFTIKTTFTQGSQTAVTDKPYPTATYVGYCGYCDVLTQGTPFASGIATNVGGDKPGTTGAGDGWHIAKAAGLPQRYITSIRIDPKNTKTVYVTLGGYARKWAAPGAIGDDTSKIGTGHVFKSTDAGATFTDVSGNLPDTPADWTVLKNGKLVVGTDLGVFITTSAISARAASGPQYARLGTGMPNVQTSTLRFKPGNPNLLVAGTYGRGVYTFDFSSSGGTSGSSSNKSPAASATGARCRAAVASRLAAAKPVSKRHRLRFTIPRSKRKDKVDIFQVSHGRHIFRERLVARFTKRSGPFTWSGKANRRGRKVTDGFYFMRVQGPGGVGPSKAIARVVLQRSHGKWHVRRDFYLRGSCGVVRFAKIERPVFGGKRGFRLRFSYKLDSASRVAIVVRRGRKFVKSFGSHVRRAKHFYSVTLPLRGLKKGNYTVTAGVRHGKQRVVVNLVSRRI